MMRFVTMTAAVLFAFSAYAQEASKAPGAPDAADTTPPKPFVYTPKPSDIVMGKDSAPVTIVEYASLSCPHCAHFFKEVLPTITKNYLDTGKAKLVYRDFPLNDPALKAADLIQCADKDRRHAFLSVLFTTQNKWAYDANYKDSLKTIAALGGVDEKQFNTCMENKNIEKSVLEVSQEATNDYKISSTPTFYINGKEQKDHDAASMGKAIDAALAAAKGK